jgi:hypothetical protein
LKTASVEKYDLEIKPAQAVAGGVGGGAQIKGQVETSELELGGENCGKQVFYLMDLAHLPANYGDRIDGILGGDFFEAKKAVLDYAEGVMWLKLEE